jgi:subtilisin-like proprotein convertase family protein
MVVCALALSPSPSRVDPQRLSPTARAQLDALALVRNTRTVEQRKIEQALFLGLLHDRGDARLAPLTDFRFVRPGRDGRLDVDVALTAADGIEAVVDELARRGAPIAAVSAAHRVITARVQFDDLEALAAVPAVRSVRRRPSAVTSRVNVSEGVSTHLVAAARAGFGVTGAGVKVCVLSNGVDSLAAVQATGDLPAVEVLAGQAGSGDEGTAMLEIVHDVAPDATLAFATATLSPVQFAQNIRDLAASGCHVMVDDVTYPDESPFQDGPIAQAVNEVTAAGILYFAAAGDDGNRADGTAGSWEGDFSPNGTIPALAGAGTVHDFGDGGQSILVTEHAEFVQLSWAEHADAASGFASTDFDVYIMNGALTTVFDASTDTQDGVGGNDFPIERAGQAFAGERIVVARSASGSTSSVPMFRLLLGRGRLDPALATGGAVYGHGAAADAYSVAAAPATAPGPFPGPFTSASVTEPTTSEGPRRIILSSTGAELTPGNRTSSGGIVRQKPDITAATRVSTATPGFSPFNGTSAAAAHAAAIAALVKAAVPAATPADIRTTLVTSAIDIHASGADSITGAGIVMPLAALTVAGATPVASLSAGTPTAIQVAGDGDGAIEPNEVWDVSTPLANDGLAIGTAIAATATSMTPGVLLFSNTSAYPDLTPAATAANSSPFRVRVGGTCGSWMTLTLAVNYAGGSQPSQSFDVALRLGGPGTPFTSSYTGPMVAIPDGSGSTPGAPALVPLSVDGGSAGVFDVDLRIDGDACTSSVGATTVGISHTFAADLRIGLQAPNGASMVAIDRVGGSGNNFCQTVLDDESAGPRIQTVVSSNAPFTGSYQPNQPLSALDGGPVTGTWQLSAQDFEAQDTGAIRAWSLVVTPAVCDAPPFVDLPPTVQALPDRTTPANQTVGPIGFTIGDDFLPATALVVSATSSNQAVVATAGLVVGGLGAARTLTITPVADASGSTTIAVRASDGVSIGESTFVLTVTAPNQTPTITAIPAQTVPENGALAPVAFTIGDDTTAPDALVVTAVSSNLVLVPAETLVLGGSGAARTISATPVPHLTGETIITITVSDGEADASTSFVLTVLPLTPPNAPRDLTASASGTSVHLAWSAPDGGPAPARYLVESSRTPLGTTLPIATVDAAQQGFDVPLARGTYFFRVRAQNDAGLSPPSNEGIASIGGDGTPGPPTALGAAITGSHVSLRWQAPARSPAPTEYRIEVGSRPGESDLGVFDTGSPANTIAAPVPAGSYVVRVRAKVGVAIGAPSNEIAFRVGAAACAAAPMAPVLLTPSVAADFVTLGWLPAAAEQATSYRLSAGTAPGSADLATFDTGTSVTAFSVATPPQGTYYVFVQAENACGLSAASNPIQVVVPAAVVPPDAPRDLNWSVSGHTVTLSWLPPARGPLSSHYLVEAGTGPNLANFGAFPFSAGSTSVVFEAVPSGTFTVRVRGINTGGAGPASNEVVVTVP